MGDGIVNPDLYHDIQLVIDGLSAEMDQNPLENDDDIKRYSFALNAILNLQWFIQHCMDDKEED